MTTPIFSPCSQARIVVDISFRELRILNQTLARYAVENWVSYPGWKAELALALQEVTMQRVNDILALDKVNGRRRPLLPFAFTCDEYDVSCEALKQYEDHFLLGDSVQAKGLLGKLADAELAVMVMRASASPSALHVC